MADKEIKSGLSPGRIWILGIAHIPRAMLFMYHPSPSSIMADEIDKKWASDFGRIKETTGFFCSCCDVILGQRSEDSIVCRLRSEEGNRDTPAPDLWIGSTEANEDFV